MASPASAASGQAGFTLVELIVIMVVIGILGAVAAPRFFDRKGFDGRSFADQTQSMLRYAQKVAIAQGRPVWIRLNGSSVAACFDSACTLQVQAPGGSNSGNGATVTACANTPSWLCEGVPAGVTAVASGLGSTFYFDALGKPFAEADIQPTLISTFPSRTTNTSPATTKIVVTGDTSYTIWVEPETGYVHN